MKKKLVIVGGGAAALALASFLDEKKFDISIYEGNSALGRKFLVAGAGGFNLTHDEDLEAFILRYTPSSFLEKAIRAFSPKDLRDWLHTIGIDTYVGTSKRVFPVQGTVPVEVLNAILIALEKKNVQLKTQHTWKGWTENGDLFFQNKSESIEVVHDIAVFALGGASWKVTGSEGSWFNSFAEKGIQTVPFEASNCAVNINWKEDFIQQAEGAALKNISVSCENQHRKGELTVTKFGLEGGAIYALSGALRKQMKEKNQAKIFLDLKPSMTQEEVNSILSQRGTKAMSKQLDDAIKLDKIQKALLKAETSKEEFMSPALLSDKIKNLPLKISSLAPLDEAISTVGGISLDEVDEHFQLKKFPNTYCIGEMLDWDAPTGGYLLQACLSMGVAVARELNGK